LCGRAAIIDIDAEADNIPLPGDSQDYMISSHVVEHLPNPIGAFMEWNRLLKSGGTIFLIFPKRDALPADAGREVSTVVEFQAAYDEGYTVDTMPEGRAKAAGGRRGHYWVFTLESMLDLIRWCNGVHGLDWEVVHTEATDAKVGNGHTVVCRFRPSERTLQDGAKSELARQAVAREDSTNLG